jgi:hypothetical protein
MICAQEAEIRNIDFVETDFDSPTDFFLFNFQYLAMVYRVTVDLMSKVTWSRLSVMRKYEQCLCTDLFKFLEY